MKDVVDKCSTKGCAIDIGTVIDNDNCTSKFSRFFATWICPYISRHLLSLNPLQARCRRYSRGER